MLNMFLVPRFLPDTIVRFHPSVANDCTREYLEQCPLLAKQTLACINVAQPKLTNEMTQCLKQAGSLGDNAIVIGLPLQALDILHNIPYKQHTTQEITPLFQKQERVCIIPDTLAVHGNLHIGSKLLLQDKSAEYVPYTVVGIASFPWIWFSKCSGLRINATRTSAVIFAPAQPVIDDFNARNNEFFWFNRCKSISHGKIETYMKEIASQLATLFYDGSTAYSGGTKWDSGINTYLVQTSTRESMNDSLTKRTGNVISTMTKMPLCALFLATVAVLCTMNVSILSRQNDFKIMYTIGATKNMIARSILAEVTIIGLCACITSTIAGGSYAILAFKIIGNIHVFGVISPPITIPWQSILYGYAITCTLTTITAAFFIPFLLSTKYTKYTKRL